MITINVGQDMAREAHEFQGGGYEYSELSNEFLTFSINGDLDEDEYDAVSELIDDIVILADTFFNGNMEESLALATELGFDTSELRGFSLDMEIQKTGYIRFTPERASPEVAGNSGRRYRLPRHAGESGHRLKNNRAFKLFQYPQNAVIELFKAISIQKEVATPDTADSAASLLFNLLSDESTKGASSFQAGSVDGNVNDPGKVNVIV